MILCSRVLCNRLPRALATSLTLAARAPSTRPSRCGAHVGQPLATSLTLAARGALARAAPLAARGNVS